MGAHGARLRCARPEPRAPSLSSAIQALIPPISAMSTGSWAVAVSGGADSVALFTLLRTTRQDVSIHVVHLDHQTRAGASTEDADFVADLSAQFSIPCTIARLDQIEPSLAKAPANTSSRYRAARQEHFRQVVA